MQRLQTVCARRKMKSLINSLLVKIGLVKDVGAPVHAGVNPVYFTDVYEGGKGWVFSWRSADHSAGMVRDGFWTKAEADDVRRVWATRREMVEHATFVHENA